MPGGRWSPSAQGHRQTRCAINPSSPVCSSKVSVDKALPRSPTFDLFVSATTNTGLTARRGPARSRDPRALSAATIPTPPVRLPGNRAPLLSGPTAKRTTEALGPRALLRAGRGPSGRCRSPRPSPPRGGGARTWRGAARPSGRLRGGAGAARRERWERGRSRRRRRGAALSQPRGGMEPFPPPTEQDEEEEDWLRPQPAGGAGPCERGPRAGRGAMAPAALGKRRRVPP